MGEVWVKQFTGGLDSRRLPETTSGGVLLKGQDGHINRGGEFEKRAAFVKAYALAAGQTIGLASTNSGLVTFGSGVAPAMPAGVTYQRLQHTDGVTALTRILSFDLYAGKVYVVAEFADGTREHFYDGTRVGDWFDGRARAAFTVVSGGVTGATHASASFTLTGGTVGAGNAVGAVTVNGVPVTNGTAIPFADVATTAAAIATTINGFTSSPEYSAAASGATVTITAATAGPGSNGLVAAVTVNGDVTYSGAATMAGGAVAAASTLAALSVNGVDVLGAPVAWTTTTTAMAEAIASQINTYTSPPDYTATAVGATVNLVAVDALTADNGLPVTFTVTNGLVLSPASGLVLAGGVDAASGTYTPGTFVKTIGSKVYAVGGPNVFFSGVKTPASWNTDTVGAGFVDMSSEASGSEELTALGKYNKYVAVFAGKTTQIWYMDPDPTQNEQVQVLNNTGTFCPRSVTQFGDNDLFYLDESGLRSLRARDASNAATTADVGVPIDTLLIARLAALSTDDRQRVCSVIEPREGRFWLSLLDTIYVFSFFAGAQVSAWSTYLPSAFAPDGTAVPFSVDDVVVYSQHVYLRSGDTIYVYGGPGATPAYDATEAEVWLPFLDAGAPTREKTFEGIDAAVSGTWDVSVGMEPTLPSVQEQIATITATTYNLDKIPGEGRSTHLSPRFKSRGTGPATLSAVVVHHDLEPVEK